ncbi:SDR family oxidoreductase [uncultured Ramlibacter sp.]|uniref:SDR family oxidoreductase n=1 Tax=uncultured Ramlibacter sp. TaxID=260755 RepID=UPI002635ED00|nr:SDR family oxidoreductase [uncultured Ramlibacter sp.]
MSTHSKAIAASQPLSSRVAVVTGASSGIGAATAALLAARGAKVALLGRRTELLQRHAVDIAGAGGVAIAVTVDVTDPRSVEKAAATIAAQLGVVNLVVNNAGVMLPSPITEHRTEDWDHMISLNLSAALRITGVFLPSLLDAAADGCPADLVNISSIAAQNIYPNFAVYSATKAATSHLSRHLRGELGVKGVRVSMIEPGIVATELQSHFSDQGAIDWLESTRETIEWLQPEDVAQAIAFTVGLPPHVNLQQVVIMPTRQAS